MKATMIATNRRYTKAQKLAYQQRVHRRRIQINVSNDAFRAGFAGLIESAQRAGERMREASANFAKTFPFPPPPVGPQMFNRLAEIAPEIMRRGKIGGVKADHVIVDELAAWQPKPERTLEEILGLDLANEVPLDQQGLGPDGWTRR